MKRVAIQGQAASFHDQAAKQYFGNDIQLICCETFRDVFLTLQNKQADKAVIANENSLYGSINEVDIELMSSDIWIEGEVDLMIEHNVAALPGTKISDITDVVSQREALAQCQKWLHTHPEIRTHNYFDTSASAALIAKEQNRQKAAICSAAAAVHHGLEVIAPSIQDIDSYTRFLVLDTQPVDNTDANKTSITIRIKDAGHAGSLHDVLQAFATRDINLTKIVSRPVPGTKWEYMFFIDFQAGMQQKIAQELIKSLRNDGHKIKILGTYLNG